MRISPTTSLSEPIGTERISEGTLAYFRARNRRRLYEIVVQEFERSGLSQADLARRLGKGTDLVCRWLGSPGNWTADTGSDLLFATSGAEASYGVSYPLGAAITTSAGAETVVAWDQTLTGIAETTSGGTALSDMQTALSETADTQVVAHLRAA